MKQLLSLLFLIIPALSQAADNDTLVINRPQKVTIITNDSLLNIKVKGREGDNDYVYEETAHMVGSNFVRERSDNGNNLPKVPIGKDDDSKMDLTAHLGFGFILPQKVSSGMDYSFGQSGEIFFTPLVFDLYMNKTKGDLISLGFGLDWRDYRMKNDVRFIKGQDGKVALGSYPQGAKPKFSRILVFGLSMPLIYQHQFNKHWGFGLGPVFNWNTYATIKTKYKMDGGTHEFKEKKINQQKFTIDAMVMLSNPVLDLYMKYCPMDVLKDSDVKFQTLTIGFYL